MERRASRTPRVVRGSVVVNRRRCGKPNCRCVSDGALHETTVLSYSEGGRTKFVTIPVGEIAAVQAAVDRYRAAKSKVEDLGNAGLAELIAVLAEARRR